MNERPIKIEDTLRIPNPIPEGEDIVIGSELYPIPDDSYMFIKENTRKEKLAVFLNSIDKEKFEMGRCYTNTKKLIEIGKRFDMNIDFYSGWVFPFSPIPVHHAWGVIENKHGFKVLDTFAFYLDKAVMDELNQKEPNGDIRKIYANLWSKKVKNYKNSESMVMGQVPEDVIYIGGKDNYKSAMNTFNDLMEKFPNHPAYNRMDLDSRGATQTQQEILNLQNKNQKEV